MIGEKSLAEEIAAVLGVSLDGRASVIGGDGHVLITLGDIDFEQNLGHIFRQVSLIIDETFPDRPEDVSLIIRDVAGKRQQRFRLWHSDTVN
jgi:hypothetical protein